VKRKRSKKLRAILPLHDRGKTFIATEGCGSLRRRSVRESEEEAIGRE